jgi:hypothetical protein
MHEPRAGRRAYICEHKDHQGVPVRKFMERDQVDEPRCTKHGKMARQRNKDYCGQPVPELTNG